MDMALASISSSSPSFHKNLKFTSWRFSRVRRHEIQVVKEVLGESNSVILGAHNLKAEYVRCYIPYAASERQSPPQTDMKLEASESEKLNFVAIDGTSSDIKDSTSSDIKYNTSRISSFLYVERTAGKPGFISFHGLPCQRREEILESSPSGEISKNFLFIGPTVLVTFLVFPSLYLRRILSTVFEDSLLTDFLILFFTEALFYGGAAIFFLLVDHIWRPLQQSAPSNIDWTDFKFGLRVSSVATLVVSLIIPLVTMGIVWPWTGPAASATLTPYLVGLIVQFVFEHYARYRKSPAWPVIPVVFQVYRLHQLNRAAQLVTALSFSLRGAENTSQTLAINSSLGTLLTVLQILGVICIWSLSSFLMRSIPSSQPIS